MIVQLEKIQYAKEKNNKDGRQKDLLKTETNFEQKETIFDLKKIEFKSRISTL